MQVVRLISDGKTVPEIAHILGLAYGTVAMHKRFIYAKTGVNSIALLVRWYLAQLAPKAR